MIFMFGKGHKTQDLGQGWAGVSEHILTFEFERAKKSICAVDKICREFPPKNYFIANPIKGHASWSIKIQHRLIIAK